MTRKIQKIRAFLPVVHGNVEDIFTCMRDGTIPQLPEGYAFLIDHDAYQIIDLVPRASAREQEYIPACYDDYGSLVGYGKGWNTPGCYTFLVRKPASVDEEGNSIP